jgi:hypothetical protein
MGGSRRPFGGDVSWSEMYLGGSWGGEPEKEAVSSRAGGGGRFSLWMEGNALLD